MKSRCSNRKWFLQAGGESAGFTLIELLAVLVIVLILAVLVFPVVKNVRLKAADAVCLTHLKTLAGAYNAYRADYGGMGPPHFAGDSVRQFFPFNEGHSYPGLQALRYYYRPGPRYITHWIPEYTWIIEPTEFCPAAKLTGIADFIEPTFGSHYTMMPGEWTKASDGSNVLGQANLRGVDKPTQIPILWDSWGGAFEWSLPLRHGNGVNVAFLDGHVETIPQTKEDGRLYRNWWGSAITMKNPDPNQLGKGAPLGRKER